MKTATDLFESFKDQFASQYAVVVFPQGYTITQLRHEKALFLFPSIHGHRQRVTKTFPLESHLED